MVTFVIETRYNVTKQCNIKHLCFFVMVACIARLVHVLRSSVCHDKVIAGSRFEQGGPVSVLVSE